MLDVEVSKLGYRLSPADLVEKALQHGNKIMAFTYSEPTIFLEYALDTARLAHQKGLKAVFKSNGYESAYAVSKMVGLIDAVNVDLKAFKDSFYQTECKARVQPVMDTIVRLKQAGIWVEVTTLVIPNENDSNEELAQIAQFLASVDPLIPWHVTPFHPDFKMTNKTRTPRSTLARAREIGLRAGLKFVYSRTDDGGMDTRCPNCNTLLIERSGFSASCTAKFDTTTGKCLACSFMLPGVWH
eukprot:TRINITY_DN2584_c0_g1_i2.p1 TRINITY_DN2584_c0_g1~~TRINITY_DN2584_c0_g1_i2.p1  ORF type:complete len:242 (-),score=56.68 TRINITY_DN2584_c0_g1_i2:127-852(-)